MNTVAYTIPEAVRVSGIGRTSLYAAIGSGALKARKYGRRTIIMADDLKAFVSALPNMRPANDNGG